MNMMMLKTGFSQVFGVPLTFFRVRFSRVALSNVELAEKETIIPGVTAIDPRTVWQRLCRFGQTNVRGM
jgi:hypothetical protein